MTTRQIFPKLIIVLVLFSFSVDVDAQPHESLILDRLEVITSDNADQLEPIAEFSAREIANTITLDPSARLLVVGGGSNELGYVEVFELETMNLIADLPVVASRVIAVSFSADGSRLASGSDDGTITVWDALSWQEISRFQISPGGNSQSVRRITFSDDLQMGTLTEDGGIKLFDIVLQQEIYQIGNNRIDLSQFVNFSSDNGSFVYGTTGGSGIGYSYIHIVDINTRQETHTFQVSDSQDYATSAVTDFSSDNRLIASTAIESTIPNIIVFETETGQAPVRFVDTPDQPREISFAPSANILAVAGNNWEPPNYEARGTLQIWSFEPGEWLIDLTEQIPMIPWDIEFNQNGNLLVTLDTESVVRFWGVPSSK
jgi:WD40 repeat protein